jgi:hypothetical protein
MELVDIGDVAVLLNTDNLLATGVQVWHIRRSGVLHNAAHELARYWK